MTGDGPGYDQARWTDDDERYEPLLSEKNHKRVNVESPLPDDQIGRASCRERV